METRIKEKIIAALREFGDKILLSPYDKDEALEVRENVIEQGFRAFDLFTDRAGEEDDDHPNFTEKARLDKAIETAFGYLVKNNEIKNPEVSIEEKCWICIRVTAK